MDKLFSLIKDFILWYKSLFRPCRTDVVNTSSKVFVGPCIIRAIMISADGVNADCDIYDGETNKDPKKTHMEALSGTTFNFEPAYGTLFLRGIYVVVNAATTFVTISYHPISPKEIVSFQYTS